MGATTGDATETETGTAATGTGTETGTATGSTTGTETETGTTATATETKPAGTETGTTDHGRESLQADLVKERKRRQALEAELEERRKADLSEHEKALEDAREEGRREGSAKVLPQLFAQEVKALATGKLLDPDILGNGPAALAHLNLTEIPLRADGSIDSEAVTTALDGLLARKPSWAAITSPGSGDQGPAGGGGPGQLTRADLETMSPREITEARKAGRLAAVLSGQ